MQHSLRVCACVCACVGAQSIPQTAWHAEWQLLQWGWLIEFCTLAA